jgi:hypothetical protein
MPRCRVTPGRITFGAARGAAADLGKGVTDPAGWPSHVDHEALGVPLVQSVCQRFGVQPRDRALAILV